MPTLQSVRGLLKGMQILVAEDCGILADVMAVKLEEQGARVIGPFASADQAIAGLDTARIDFALVDMVLRDRPADQLLDALADRGIPHIVITGFEALPTNASETALGNMSKPIDWDYLLSAITPFAATSR